MIRRNKQTKKADISKGEDIEIQSEEVGTGHTVRSIEISLHIDITL